MKVCAVVLNHNNYPDTRECIESLQSLNIPPMVHFSILLVDSGSRDGSPEALQSEFPHLACIVSKENLGYAGGNNLGIESALREGADWIWLLNNDTVVHPDALAHLVSAAKRTSEVGILGSIVYDYDDRGRVQFAGGKLNKLRGTGRGLDAAHNGACKLGGVVECDFVTGASLLARKKMIEDVGLLDEALFLYLEDLDWALRAKKQGWKVFCVRDSVVWHKGNSTSSRVRPLIIYYVSRNSLYICKKHFPLCFPAVLFNCIRLRVFNFLIKGVYKGFEKEDFLYARMGMKGIIDFFQGKMGRYPGKRPTA
ncbi:MAG: glycosyltransferase family 2 protein [Actinobacteria bacterium]|nr:glycosyltransferase family 2 protein [Actinomycetota bacterium]